MCSSSISTKQYTFSFTQTETILSIMFSLQYSVSMPVCIGGLVVEYSPATRVTRVRFPVDARSLFSFFSTSFLRDFLPPPPPPPPNRIFEIQTWGWNIPVYSPFFVSLIFIKAMLSVDVGRKVVLAVDILGTSCDQYRSMAQYSFTSTETTRPAC